MPSIRSRALLALVLAVGLIPLAGADTAPRVPSAQACTYLADYALVARALALERDLSNPQAEAILERIYVIKHPLILEVQGRLRNVARGDGRSAQKFSQEFLNTCISREGDITAFLGTTL